MSKPGPSSTTRFSDRVDNYTKYRPSYPRSVIDWISNKYHINPLSQVADIGSGTGIFTQLLMDAGWRVCAVEPNLEMRKASEQLHGANALYSSLDGTAEATNLADNSVDMITAAQAGHWFNLDKARHEFIRILRPGGVLVLIWNRRTSSSPFQMAYERLLQTLPEYSLVNHHHLGDNQLAKLFAGTMEKRGFENRQVFDQAGFRGRVFSSSYTPGPQDTEYEKFSQQINDLFANYATRASDATQASVSFDYSTQVYSGRLS